jgi:hypothetical protein
MPEKRGSRRSEGAQCSAAPHFLQPDFAGLRINFRIAAARKLATTRTSSTTYPRDNILMGALADRSRLLEMRWIRLVLRVPPLHFIEFLGRDLRQVPDEQNQAPGLRDSVRSVEGGHAAQTNSIFNRVVELTIALVLRLGCAQVGRFRISGCNASRVGRAIPSQDICQRAGNRTDSRVGRKVREEGRVAQHDARRTACRKQIVPSD